MPIDLKMDMGSLLKGLSNKNGGKESVLELVNTFKNSIILLMFSVMVFTAYFYLYYTPMSVENIKKQAEIARLVDLKNKTAEMDTKIATLKKKLSETKEHYLESLSHFGNSEDLGELYQSVSTLAAKYDLIVLNIKEVPIKATPAPAPVAAAPVKNAPPVVEGASPAAAAPAPAKVAAKPKPLMDVKEVQVAVELKGKYGNYIKFKEDLAVAEMLLKVNTENIKVKNDKDEPGSIYVTLNLSTYAIDKKPFQKVMENDEGKEKENAK
jgi:Tfp pilus assembly protein PilO